MKITLYSYTARRDHCYQPTINSGIFRKEIFGGNGSSMPLTHIMHGTPERDRGDRRATGEPERLVPETCLFTTGQSELVLSLSKEDPRTPGRTAIAASAASGSCIMRVKSAARDREPDGRVSCAMRVNPLERIVRRGILSVRAPFPHLRQRR
jgi:hypothetical protein